MTDKQDLGLYHLVRELGHSVASLRQEVQALGRAIRDQSSAAGDTGGNLSHKGQKITYHAATDRLMRCGGLPQHTGKRARNWGLRVREADSNRWLHFNGEQLFARTGNTDALRFINYSEAQAVAVAAGLEQFLKPHALPPSAEEVKSVSDARREVWGIRLNTDLQSPFLYFREELTDSPWTGIPDKATLRTFAAMTDKRELLVKQARKTGGKVPEYEVVKLK